MDIFINTTISALVMSVTYISIALGISCIFSMLRLVTFSHGEMYMLGSYLAYLFYVVLGFHYGIVVPLVTVIVFLVGMGLERGLWQPLIDKPHAYSIIMSIGLCLCLQAGALLIFGERDKSIPVVFPGILEIANIRIAWERVAAFVGNLVILVLITVFFKATKAGQAMRAISLDPEVSALQGIGVNRLRMAGFGMGCALAAAAGTLIAPIYVIFPTMGLAPISKAFIIMVLGGLGSLVGVVPAGLIIGFTEAFGLAYVGQWANLFGYLIFVLVLLIRPKGLMGYEA